MGIFLSNYTSKLDDKNRLSIPSAFRNIIGNEGNMVVYGYCSFTSSAIEICTEKRILELQNYIEELELYSTEREALEIAIFSGSQPLIIDNRGRIMLPLSLLQFSKIEKTAVFVGRGKNFEIWSPDLFNEAYQKARDYSISQKITLKQKKEG